MEAWASEVRNARGGTAVAESPSPLQIAQRRTPIPRKPPALIDLLASGLSGRESKEDRHQRDSRHERPDTREVNQCDRKRERQGQKEQSEHRASFRQTAPDACERIHR